MHPFLSKLADKAGLSVDEMAGGPVTRNRTQEQAWLRGWYVKAKNNRPQRSKTTHVKRRNGR